MENFIIEKKLNIKKLVNSYFKLKTNLAKERFIEILLNLNLNNDEWEKNTFRIKESEILNIIELILNQEKYSVLIYFLRLILTI